MKLSFIRSFTAGTAILTLAAAVAVTAPATGIAEEKKVNAQGIAMPKAPSRAELLTVRENDIVLGAEDAPITMIEYASMSCSHCAGFHKDTFPKLKENYIDTGKVKFILRDFPLNRPAVLGATIARCAPKDKYYKYVSALFSSQDEWLSGDAEQKLKAIATMGGMSEEAFYECVKNKDISEGIVLKSRYNAVKSLNIRSTPTFFIDGITYEGAKDYKFFAGALDKLVKQAEKKAKKSEAAKPAKEDIVEKDKEKETDEATAESGETTAEATGENEPSLTEKIVNKVKETAVDIKKTLQEGVPAKPAATGAVALEATDGTAAPAAATEAAAEKAETAAEKASDAVTPE